MIGVGIVGCNYGRTVLLPAFRTDPRCEVVALAGTDRARTAGLRRPQMSLAGSEVGRHWSRIARSPRSQSRYRPISSPSSHDAPLSSASRSSSRSHSPPISQARR